MTHPLSGRGKAVAFIRAHVAYEGDDCLMWPFHLNRGYPLFGYHGKILYAHNFMCELAHGPAPSPKHQAAHSCGRGHLGCINPRHLSWKTNSQNQLDSVRDGTHYKKRGGPRYKLTRQQVTRIKTLKGQATAEAVAVQYGVHRDSIGKIWRGVTWADVQPQTRR